MFLKKTKKNIILFKKLEKKRISGFKKILRYGMTKVRVSYSYLRRKNLHSLWRLKKESGVLVKKKNLFELAKNLKPFTELRIGKRFKHNGNGSVNPLKFYTYM